MIWLTSQRTVTHTCAGSSYLHFSDYGTTNIFNKDACTHTHTVQANDVRDSTLYFTDRKEAFKWFNKDKEIHNRNRIDSILISK